MLLVLAVLNFALHSVLMIFSYGLQFSNAQSYAGYFANGFFPAMAVKDSVSGITAMLAAILIFRRHALGWWMAVIHWNWYLTWNAIIVMVAEIFTWQFPVRYQPAEIVPNIAKCFIYSCVAITFFNLKPILRMLDVSVDGRLWRVIGIFVGSISLGFLINWWSSIR